MDWLASECRDLPPGVEESQSSTNGRRGAGSKFTSDGSATVQRGKTFPVKSVNRIDGANVQFADYCLTSNALIAKQTADEVTGNH
jgi:hypothetical protein